MLLNPKKKNNVEKCGETEMEEISRSKPLGQKSALSYGNTAGWLDPRRWFNAEGRNHCSHVH